MSRIYLVEDHTLVRDGLRVLLERAGHEVIGESGDSQTAFAQLVQLHPEIVLLDLYLDNQSGMTLLEQMQERKLSSRAIVTTMSEQPRHVVEALRLGAMGYILKDSAVAELIDAVAAVARGQRYLCRKAAVMAVDGLTGQTSSVDSLSPREAQVVSLVVRGLTSVAIGEQLHLSPKTVESYRSRIMAKLHINDLPSLVRLAIREGIIRLDE